MWVFNAMEMSDCLLPTFIFPSADKDQKFQVFVYNSRIGRRLIGNRCEKDLSWFPP